MQKEVTSRSTQDSAGGQEIRGLELSFPLPDFWGGAGLEVEEVTTGQ